MHYLNPFFNTSRPIYIKLYAWTLPSTESQISPGTASEINYVGANGYYNSSKGGWLQAAVSIYSGSTYNTLIYGMRMTNTYLFHSAQQFRYSTDGRCAHTHGKRWFGRNKTSNSISDSTYGTRTSAGNYWDTTDEITSSSNYRDNHNSFSNSNNCYCTWKVTYKQTDPANAQGGVTWDDWGTENGANAGEYKYHIWQKKADDFSLYNGIRTGGATVASGRHNTSYGVNNVGGAKSSGHLGNPVANTWSWADGDKYVNKNGTITSSRGSGTTAGRQSHNLRGIEITGIRNNTTLFGRIFAVKDGIKQYIIYEDETASNGYGIRHGTHASYTEFRTGSNTYSSIESKGNRVWQIRILDPLQNDNSDTYNSNGSLTNTDV